ncbi:hypothetical protein [Streptomyces sp. IMTB 2501]|uniref:hypothetical protein n=1 Tax=Streptomyces sp. IMTB 2501 TaxID=1776340 RepID=UPI0009A1E5B9|nr:hypothetical protein [Streptomyces sp. IMTB 2501]
MRNQCALAATCTAVAALGLAAPVAAADDMGHGNGGGDPGYGQFSGHLSGDTSIHGHFSDNGNRGFGDGGDSGRDPGRGDVLSRGDDSGNGGRGGEFGGRGDELASSDGDGRRYIEATPSAIATGAPLSVTVDDCRGGTVSSRAFPTAQLHPLRDDTSRAGARIDNDARPGRYDITAHCDGRSLTRPSAFTVLGGVEGGAGGISAGATRADTAIGAGLVAWAVIGGGVYWLRRRNEKRF